MNKPKHAQQKQSQHLNQINKVYDNGVFYKHRRDATRTCRRFYKVTYPNVPITSVVTCVFESNAHYVPKPLQQQSFSINIVITTTKFPHQLSDQLFYNQILNPSLAFIQVKQVHSILIIGTTKLICHTDNNQCLSNNISYY